ncbi:MAG: nicotinate (nicotinamide) nucleotide adenylyltransferase [Bacteroidales bacterium]
MKKRIKTGLFFGSFNPIHIGHMIIGQYFNEFTDLDEVWFVVSPHNPLKEKKTLLDDNHRLYMVNIAVEDDPRLRSCNIEFGMPKPSYTIDTLTYLSEKYPHKKFVLIGGSDILPSFHKWKNHQEILNNYTLYIYNRPGYHPGEYSCHPAIRFFNAPQIELSASFIRKALAKGKDVSYMLPAKVWEHIQEMLFYR